MDNYPFVEEVVRLRHGNGSVTKEGEFFNIRGLYAEPSFFNIFSYHLKAGNPQAALSESYSIVISEETALKFFGNEDPMNKILNFENIGDFTVTGVLKDIEMKSHFKFDALFSFATVPSLERSGVLDSDINNWSSFDKYYTYVLLRNKDDQSMFKEQLSRITNDIFPEPENKRFGFELQNLLDINLGINLWMSMPGTKKSFDIIFIPFLAILIIFLACFNYIILTIARSLKRTIEIGLRKVFGAKVSNAVYLLSKNYMKLILYSAVFAIPIAYIFSYMFYQEFAFRPELSLWVLPAALLFILILTLITISSQTIKAALINPAATLREE